MKMLAGSFTLWHASWGPRRPPHAVLDVEAHCRNVLDHYLRSRGGRLNQVEYENALAFLVTLAWRLSGLDAAGRPLDPRPRGAFDPSRGIAFSTYTHRVLSLRMTDWYRDRFYDKRYGQRPAEESLESLAEAASRRQGDRDGGDPMGYLELRSPGSRDDFIDDLNRHAYHDPTEEVLTRVASTIAR